MNIQLKAIQTYYQIISIISPKYAFKKAANLFQTVRKKSIRPREQSFFNKARHSTLLHDNETIDIYEIGNTSSTPILLLHGWDSNAGSLSKIADMLVKKDYKVITMNLPAHAFSKKKKTNFFEAKNAFKKLILHVNPSQPISIVAHSFGSGVVSAAMTEVDYPIDKMVLLTSPNKMIDFFVDFKALIKLGEKPYQYMCNWASKLLNEDLETLEISEKLLQLQFKHLLLIHDKKDKVIPYNNTKIIHEKIPNSTIVNHPKIGHYRMLWDDAVIKTIESFLINK